VRHTIIALALAGCVTGPTNGTTTGSGSTVGRNFVFEGYTDHPGETVVLEVLRRPTDALENDANWAKFGQTTTTTTPTYFNDPQHQSPLYYWSSNAAPVPTSSDTGRWPSGGLVRTRARRIDSQGNSQVLPTFDDATFATCFNQHQNDPWTDFDQCVGMSGTNGMVIAQDAFLTSDAATVPDYLGRKDPAKESQADAIAYYLRWGAPLSLAQFKSRYGFPNGSGFGHEATATYYNDNDLGLGREMHCIEFPSLGIGVACYVTNYSGTAGKADFTKSASAALDEAVNRTGSFATVAMVYDPSIPFTSPGLSPVNFVVYNPAGDQQFAAQLDSTAKHTGVPTNCIACHGIASNFDYQNLQIDGPAQFLPFDPATFKFSTVSGFTLDDQQDQLRQLNAMVEVTQPTSAIEDWIDGMYKPGSVTTAGSVANDTYIPVAWNDNITDQGTYIGLIKRGCRTCHASSTNTALDFRQESDFFNQLSTVRLDVCGSSHAMPQAERVSKNLWSSGGRAYLISGWPLFVNNDSPNDDKLEGCAP